MRFYDTKTWRELISLTYRAVIQHLQFTDDGTRLIVSEDDNIVEIFDTRDYAARQKDRDARFDEIPAARAYVQKLLSTDAPADKLKDVVRNDASISTLRRLVALEQLDMELRKRKAATQPATTRP